MKLAQMQMGREESECSYVYNYEFVFIKRDPSKDVDEYSLHDLNRDERYDYGEGDRNHFVCKKYEAKILRGKVWEEIYY